MFRADVTLEGLMFAEGFLAWRIVFASKSLMTFVGSKMSSKSGSSKKTFGTILPSTVVLSFVGMRTFDMCLKMFVLEIRFITVVVCAYERAFVCMYLQMCL